MRALNGRPGTVRVLPDSGLAAVTFDRYRIRVPEGCRPNDEARRAMDELAIHPERMQFIPRVDERRA